MSKLLNVLLNAGIRDEYPKYLNSKIYLTNLLALIIVFCIVVPYIGITFIFFKPLIFIPIICAFIGLIALFLNYINLVNTGRFIFALLPVSMPLTYFAYLMPPGSPKYLEMYIISVAFSLVPFLVFDIREKAYLIVCAIIIICVFVFGLDWLNAILVMDIDASLITNGPLGTLNLFIGMVLTMVGILILAYQNFRSNNKTFKVIEEMNQQSEEMKTSENELKEKIILIEKTQAEEKKRNWATQGVAEVGTLLRSNIDSQQLFDQITSYLTKYIEANQCSLFLVEKGETEKDSTLKLHSCYAYDRKKFVEKTIAAGQSLVGQSFIEKSTIYMRDVPDGYTKITSGLGESTPSEILIVPLIVNENVEGVFEFAAFNTIEKHVIEFLEQLGETLAAFINVNRINEQTKVLLQESQEQSEQMRSQEEEMRQNMEELAATQEEMTRKEQEYLHQIEQLKKENEQLKGI